MVETEVRDAVLRRWVVADHLHLETDLRPVTELPACGEQLRVDEQGTRLRLGQFHWRSPFGNSGLRRILFAFRSSGFTAVGPAPTNSCGMVYSDPPGSARRILIREADGQQGKKNNEKTRFPLNSGPTSAVNTRQKLGGNPIGPAKSSPEDGGSPRKLLRKSFGTPSELLRSNTVAPPTYLQCTTPTPTAAQGTSASPNEPRLRASARLSKSRLCNS